MEELDTCIRSRADTYTELKCIIDLDWSWLSGSFSHCWWNALNEVIPQE